MAINIKGGVRMNNRLSFNPPQGVAGTSLYGAYPSGAPTGNNFRSNAGLTWATTLDTLGFSNGDDLVVANATIAIADASTFTVGDVVAEAQQPVD